MRAARLFIHVGKRDTTENKFRIQKIDLSTPSLECVRFPEYYWTKSDKRLKHNWKLTQKYPLASRIVMVEICIHFDEPILLLSEILFWRFLSKFRFVSYNPFILFYRTTLSRNNFPTQNFIFAKVCQNLQSSVSNLTLLNTLFLVSASLALIMKLTYIPKALKNVPWATNYGFPLPNRLDE